MTNHSGSPGEFLTMGGRGVFIIGKTKAGKRLGNGETKTNVMFKYLMTERFMNERELLKRIIDFSFIIKAQLYSDETALLRSILNVVIMEAEDVIELIDEKTTSAHQVMSERMG